MHSASEVACCRAPPKSVPFAVYTRAAEYLTVEPLVFVRVKYPLESGRLGEDRTPVHSVLRQKSGLAALRFSRSLFVFLDLCCNEHSLCSLCNFCCPGDENPGKFRSGAQAW